MISLPLYQNAIVDMLQQAPAAERFDTLACTKVLSFMAINDNHAPIGGGISLQTDPHGQAALLLVESLIHGLLARSIINVNEAIDIVDTANSVQAEVAEAADGAGARMWQAHALLAAIADSLRFDSGAGPMPLRTASEDGSTRGADGSQPG